MNDTLAMGIRLLLNQGDGTFVAGDVVPTDPEPLTVEIGDLDGDGSHDIIDGNRTESGVQDAMTTIMNDQCAPFFTQRVTADDGGLYWPTTLPYLGVRGGFTTAGDIGEFAVDQQFVATDHRLIDPELPGAATGFWYLIRPDCTGASWTSAGPVEVLGRDTGLP